MTTQARQLILELLLIREKFSEREVKAAFTLLTERKQDNFFRDLSLLYEAAAGNSKVRPKTKSPTKTGALLKKRRDNLIRGLKEDSPSSKKLLSSLADRFGLKSDPENSDQFRLLITEKLRDLSENELKAFFAVDRDRSTPDQGYVGLANFLVNKD